MTTSSFKIQYFLNFTYQSSLDLLCNRQDYSYILLFSSYFVDLLNYSRLSKKPLLFKSFTGLELAEFDSICKKVESRYPQYQIKRLSKRKRTRKVVGAGNHFKLTVRDRFLMLLVYYRLYITHTLSGFLFDLDQSNVYRDIKAQNYQLKDVPLPQKLYNITRRLRMYKKQKSTFLIKLLQT